MWSKARGLYDAILFSSTVSDLVVEVHRKVSARLKDTSYASVIRSVDTVLSGLPYDAIINFFAREAHNIEPSQRRSIGWGVAIDIIHSRLPWITPPILSKQKGKAMR